MHLDAASAKRSNVSVGSIFLVLRKVMRCLFDLPSVSSVV